MERKRSQPRLLQVLRDLPVCTGVRRGIEDFYLTISGETVKLNRFLDSSGMAAAAGFKLRARNMTALGVQVVGMVLNKNISTGDDLWGLPWAELPLASRFTELEISVSDIYVTLFLLAS